MTAPTLTLADFLVARLDDDEAAVRSGPLWLGRALDPELAQIHWGGEHGNLFHVPADRFATEIAAKREIIEWYRLTSENRGVPSEAWIVMKNVLGNLALPYAGHHEYREEWRPMICGCDKVLHKSRREAKKAARRAPSGRMHPYECPDQTGFWHAGHMPRKVSNGRVSKADWLAQKKQAR